MKFWEPILRAWLTALPYFIVGMLGALIQMRRLFRQHVTTAVTSSVKAAVAEQLGPPQDAAAGRHATAQGQQS